ncbi:restriction endonuclease subunit S [Vibrio breoganii]|uniref:restriction endonuclease subunit S n=1 Tax=Vibrio breoganii TaxID=553239 RepID=UPI000C81EA81|nr:restriction endonuclease subunit S [Vibrio breoganii]PML61930.1 restriction endonuclease subunit S [Vibrio breoganii]
MARELNSSEIPDGWSYGLLDNYAERCSGHTPSKSFPEYWDGGIKWISLADSFRLDKGLVEETDKEISKLGTENSSAQVHPAGTVVLSRDAGIGKSGVMAEPMAVSQHFIAWKCDINDKIHNWFLYNWLQLNKHEFERQAVGSTIKTIGLPYFKKLKIALPPYAEQRKIAKILSTWDKAIATTEKLIETSKQQKKSLMQQLLTGKKRLVNPETGKAFEGEWEEVRLSEIVEVSNKKSVQSNEFPVITSSRKGIYLQEEYFKKQVASEDNSGYKLVPRGYITYRAMSDDGLFRFNVQNILDDSIISPAYGVFKFKESCDGNFCLEVMNSKQNMNQIRRLSQGGTRISFKTTSFKEIKFVLPNLIEQQKIASVLTAADKEIEVLEAKLAHFKQEKKALMQQLLTGKRRVKVDEMEVV